MKCDRCGAFSDADPGHEVSLYKFVIDNHDDANHVDSYDLCPACLASFKAWAGRADERRELRGCRSCPKEWLDAGDGPCPFCGHADTEIRTSFFAKGESRNVKCHSETKP